MAKQPKIRYTAVIDANQIIQQAGEGSKFRRLVVVIHERVVGTVSSVVVHYEPRERHGRAFVCVADKELTSRECFAFLNKIRQLYNFSLQSGGTDGFESTIQEQMAEFSRPGADKIQAIQDEITKVKDVMLENIEAVMHRGERLEDLLDTTNAIALEAALFDERATNLSRTTWWKNTKLWFALGCIIIMLLIIIIFGACGLDFSGCGNS